jgi:hypothetical protein
MSPRRDFRAQEKKYYEDLLEPLAGATIKGVKIEYVDEPGLEAHEPTVVLQLRMPDTLALPSDLRGKTVDVEVWQDPEGNGPGFLAVPWELNG